MLLCLIAMILPAADETVRLDLTHDTWLSGVGVEADGSNGAVPRLKLKSHQEFSLVDAELSLEQRKGRVIRRATLHVKSTGEPRLKRVTVGGLASRFHEGTATGYEVQNGSSTFNHFEHPGTPWAGIGDVTNVMFGPRGELWKTADASVPDKDGWQTIPIDPRVIAARVVGLSGGFVLFDDTGTEWTRDGEKYSRTLFPNRFIFSRDQNRSSAPYFTVVLGEKDDQPPDAVRDLRLDSETPELPAGEAKISWITPKDAGPAGTLGFLATLDGSPADLKLMPLAGKAGERIHVRLTRPAKVFSVRAVDAAGNLSAATEISVKPSKRDSKPSPLREELRGPGRSAIEGLKLGDARVAVIDELDVVDPIKGTILRMGSPTNIGDSSHLLQASTGSLRLQAAKGEVAACQILVAGKVDGLTAAFQFTGESPADVTFGRYLNVMTKDGPRADPIVPLTKPINAPEAGVNFTSLHMEVQVKKEAPAGTYIGTLNLTSGAGQLKIPCELNVHRFTLPDHLSFLPEMNCYGLPENDRDFYRLAHLHRTILNRVPYGQNGLVAEGCAPKWDGKKLDWTAWDKRFGPLFDGSAFADLPRKNVPIELFYLPLHENWPTPIEGNYNGDYWADRAFSAQHRDAFVAASKLIAEHVRTKQWNDTFFECFFNGKNDFKDRGWSRGSSPWLLDEPANFQDYWALRYFGGLFHQGINAAPPGKAKLVFRADISRPQWQRDLLDDVLDMNIVSSAVRDYREMVMERKARLGQVVIEYGSTNPPGASNIQPVAWSIDAWTLGLDGVLPWQTIGTLDSWEKADELSLFYPAKNGGAPIPSVRLKAYRRGQQDVEYLTLWAKYSGEPRWSIAQRVRSTLKANSVRRSTGVPSVEDAGRVEFDKLTTAHLARFRESVADEINRVAGRKVTSDQRLVDFQTPKRDPKPLGECVVR